MTPNAPRTPRLLILVDDERVRTIVSATLSYAGYFPHLSSNANQAITATLDAGVAPDVVIADSEMLQRCDSDFFEVLQADPRAAETALLLLSSNAGQDAAETGPAHAAEQHLTGPVRPSEVLRRVRRLLPAECRQPAVSTTSGHS